MANITIDGKEYDTDTLSENAKAQLVSLKFCDGELQRLQAEAAALQTARMAYARALQEELNKPAADVLTDNEKKPEPEKKNPDKPKGLLGIFGKK